MECPWKEEDLGRGFLGFCGFDDGGYCFEVVLSIGQSDESVG